MSLKNDQILALWRDPKFAGSFSGLSTFQDALRNDKNINISYSDLLNIFKHEADFITTTRPIRNFRRRRMDVHGYGSVWQADLAEMPADKGYKYFLLCVDIFSAKIFCHPLQTKSSQEVKAAFEIIFKEANTVCNKLETDQGSEFLGNKKYFKEKKVYFKIKTGNNKASFAEHSIYLVKRRLYRLLRALIKADWVTYLSQVVANLNNTPSSAIGGLRPAEIQSSRDDPKIDATRDGFHALYTVEKLQKNQTSYDKNKRRLQPGAYVYADFPSSLFDKSFDLQRRQLYIVKRVLAGRKPELYYLVDLMNDDVKGTYYRAQLHETVAPEPSEFFHIEKVLLEQKFKGKVWSWVKFQGYPKKFNRWVLKESMIDND